MLKKTDSNVSASNITNILNNLQFEINSKKEFTDLIVRVGELNTSDKNKVIDTIHRRISRDINALDKLSSLTSFYFGSIEKTALEPWLIPSASKDKLIRRRFTQLDKCFKLKVQSILENEVEQLSKEAIAHNNQLCKYERYIFTRGFESQFGWKVIGADCKYQAAFGALLRFYGLKVSRAENCDGLWDIIDSLVAIQQANTLSLNSDTQSDRPRKDNLTFVHIFDNFLEKLIHEKFESFHYAEVNRCKTAPEIIDMFYKYPIIRNHSDSISARCDQILRSV